MNIEGRVPNQHSGSSQAQTLEELHSVNDSPWSDTASSSALASQTTGFKRIMLVDDDDMILEPLEAALQDDNVLIDAFDNPLKALESARHQAYDVVISDQNMPEMRGIDFIRQLRALQPTCTGMILSSCKDSATLMDAINDAHVYRYILKPWVDEELREVVGEALSYHDNRAETERLADKARVSNGSMTRYRACMRDLETKYPGITQVDRDNEGAIILKPEH